MRRGFRFEAFDAFERHIKVYIASILIVEVFDNLIDEYCWIMLFVAAAIQK